MTNAEFNRLFNEHRGHIFAYLLSQTRNREIAEDLTQNTFLVFFRDYGDTPPEEQKLRLRKVAKNQLGEYYKKIKRRQELAQDLPLEVMDFIPEEEEERNTEFIPDACLEQADFRRLVMSFIEALGPEQSEAVRWYYFDELSVKEIAELQGVSEGTVKSRLNYARNAIKRAVEGYEKESGIKLHAFPFFPFMHWLFSKDSAVNGLPAPDAMAMALSRETGAAVAAETVKTAAVKAGVSVATKVVAGIAAVVLAGGGFAAGMAVGRQQTSGIETQQPFNGTVDPFVEVELTFSGVDGYGSMKQEFKKDSFRLGGWKITLHEQEAYDPTFKMNLTSVAGEVYTAFYEADQSGESLSNGDVITYRLREQPEGLELTLREEYRFAVEGLEPLLEVQDPRDFLEYSWSESAVFGHDGYGALKVSLKQDAYQEGNYTIRLNLEELEIFTGRYYVLGFTVLDRAGGIVATGNYQISPDLDAVYPNDEIGFDSVFNSKEIEKACGLIFPVGERIIPFEL